MTRTAAALLCLIALSACGERQDTAAPAAAASVEPPVAVAGPAQIAATPPDLEASCRQAVLRLAGQEGDTVQYQARGATIATVSWRAPVDGGRLTMTCTVGTGGVKLATDVGQVSVDASTVSAASAAQNEAR